MSALLLRHSGSRLRKQVSLVASMADAEYATVESYVEAQNVFVLEGDFGSDTDAAQAVAGSSSAHGLGVAPLAVQLTDVCTPPRSQSSAFYGSPRANSDIASFSSSTSTRQVRNMYFHQGGTSSLTGI